MGDLSYRQGDWRGAEEDWVASGLATVLKVRGQRAALAGQDDLALLFFRAAVKTGSQNESVTLAYAEHLVKIGRYQEAISLRDESASNTQSVSLLVVLGGTYIQLQNASKARKAFERAVHLEPNSAEAYFWLGYESLVAENDPDHAKCFLTRALELDPNHISAFIFLGHACRGRQGTLMVQYSTMSAFYKSRPEMPKHSNR